MTIIIVVNNCIIADLIICSAAKKFIECFVICIEIELSNGVVKQCCNAVVAQIANGTFMGVVDSRVGSEYARLNVEPHFFVCIAEWHAIRGKSVDVLH